VRSLRCRRRPRHALGYTAPLAALQS